MELIHKYFPNLSPAQYDALEQLQPLYEVWNSQINVISRKDMDNFYERHVLHSLAIGKVVNFSKGHKVLDVGTGGGFPGIPLAILFPEAKFTLMDSIGKKIKVVNGVISSLDLKNARGIHLNVKDHHQKYDFIVSRAVTKFNDFLGLVKSNLNPGMTAGVPNGILYLKGGDLSEELREFANQVMIYDIRDHIEEEFFETKKVVHYPS